MSINVGIVDQRVRKLAEELATEFETRLNIKNDEVKQRSTAFVFLVTQTILDLTDEEALDCLTEAGNDFGIDAIHIGDIEDGEFPVTLFQGKYKQKLESDASFPQSGIEKVIQAIGLLFDPDATITANPRLLPRIEEIRSLVRDGHIPRVRAVMCNNGLKWNDISQSLIDQSGYPPDQVEWDYANHDSIVRLMQSTKQVDDRLSLKGKAIVEDFDYCRVLVGKVPVTEIAGLFERHGDLLLERNVRRFLGIGNRVNHAIAATLASSTERKNFYLYNNGITLVCRQFSYNALQNENYQVRAEGLQVINGGQTCKTIQRVLSSRSKEDFDKSYVLVRLYELPSDQAALVRNITYATNSQNPVDLRDLKSNDQRQIDMELALKELGYEYRRQRGTGSSGPQTITNEVAAKAVLSIWRRRPHQAKFQEREHFGKLYDLIFSKDLNGTQVVIATDIFLRVSRLEDLTKKRVFPYRFAPYASCFIAMLLGRYLLADLKIELHDLNHLRIKDAVALLRENESDYWERALWDIDRAVKRLYGEQDVSLQRLSATFRRGDLIVELAQVTRLPSTSCVATTELPSQSLQ